MKFSKKTNNVDRLNGIALGLLLGFLFALALGWFFDLGLTSKIEANFIQFATILSTLAAAFLALKGISAQIQSNRDEISFQREASLMAANASLPLALTSLTRTSIRAAQICLKMETENKSSSDLISEITLSNGTIALLKEAIEYADTQSQDRISNLIRTYQVLYSRLTSSLTRNRGVIAPHFASAVDWAVFYRLSSDCFKYARGEEMQIPRQIEDFELRPFFSVTLLASAQNLVGIDADINRRVERGNFEVF